MIELGTRLPATQQNTVLPERQTRARFGNAATIKAAEKATQSALEQGVGKVANIGVANWLEKLFTPINRVKFNLAGMSLEDWAGRFLTVFAVYIPQGIISIRDNKHKWETNGRNALVWTMTLAVQMLSKHKKYGVNAGVDQLMRPRAEGEKVHALVDKFRLKGDYFNLLKRAGVESSAADRKTAFWSTLEKNQLDTVENYRRQLPKLTLEEFKKLATSANADKEVKKLVDEVKEATGKKGDDLMNAAREKFIVTENKFLRKVVNRITTAKFLATGIITVATMYLIGNLAMEIIFRTVAHLDHDFDPEKLARDKAKKKAVKEARKSGKKSGAVQQAPQQPKLAQLTAPLPPPAVKPEPPVSAPPPPAAPPAPQPPIQLPPIQLPPVQAPLLPAYNNVPYQVPLSYSVPLPPSPVYGGPAR